MTMVARMIGICVVLVCFAADDLVRAEEHPDASQACDHYCPKQEVAGELRIAGSTTLQQLAALWADGFRRIHPAVQIHIDCRGSETVLPELTRDGSIIGVMSRPLRDDERREMETQVGIRIVSLTVGHDAMGVVVNTQNPLQEVTWTAERGLLVKDDGTSVVKTWGDLGLDGEWSSMPVNVHAAKAPSGTRSFVDGLLWGDRTGAGGAVQEHASREDLVRAVAADRAGWGVISLSRPVPDDVRLVPVALAGQQGVAPTDEQLLAGRYPLVRPLTLVVALPGDSLDDPLREEFVAYVLSQCGQHELRKDGYLPVSRSELHVQEEKLGWNRQQ